MRREQIETALNLLQEARFWVSGSDPSVRAAGEACVAYAVQILLRAPDGPSQESAQDQQTSSPSM